MEKRKLIWLLSSLLILLLAACGAEDGLGTAVPVGKESSEFASASESVDVVYEPAVELPTEPADLIGGLLEFGDGRLLLGSGMVDIHPDGTGGYATDHDGPEVEIIIDEATQFFADVTQLGAARAGSGSISVQQQVEAVAQPDSLPYPAFISIWGEPRGNEFYARIVLFDVPGD